MMIVTPILMLIILRVSKQQIEAFLQDYFEIISIFLSVLCKVSSVFSVSKQKTFFYILLRIVQEI